LGFTKREVDANLYYIMVGGLPPILVLYVDDLILTRVVNLIQDCKEDLAREFEMKDMGLMQYFLGLEVWQGDGEIFVRWEVHYKDSLEILYAGLQVHDPDWIFILFFINIDAVRVEKVEESTHGTVFTSGI